MRHRILPIPILLLAMIPRASPQERQSPATFAVSVNLIKVPIAVFDPKGDSVQDLRHSDFILYEDGAQQQIRSFGLDRNPVSIVLVIDTSATVKKELNKIKDAAKSFVQALSSEDRVSIIVFADEVSLVQDWTSDKKTAQKALGKIKPGIRTALYDAMFDAAQDQLAGIDGRKAIILLTDCLNNQSRVGFSDASLAIIQSQASLYVVSKTVIVREEARHQRRVVMLSDIYKRLFGDDNYIEEFFQKREAEMVDLAEKTGGRCYFPADYDRIKGVYEEVARELKNQHFLTYVSSQRMEPNSYHRISVNYLQPSSKLIYRRGYYFEPRPIRRSRY